jgi:hypothetical protein
MGVDVTHLPDYTYIRYVREGYHDLDCLKKELAGLVPAGSEQKDVVIDFSESDFIVSSEIRVIVTLLRRLGKSAVNVHLIASLKVKQVLLSNNLQKVAGFFIYDSLQQCTDRIKQR